jgi:hypothetical protein
MVQKAEVPGVRPYDAPAGGWGALKATALAIRDHDAAVLFLIIRDREVILDRHFETVHRGVVDDLVH